MTTPVALLLRSFRGMQRLAPSVGDRDRYDLAVDLADGVAAAVSGARAPLRVVTADADVTKWARERGIEVIAERRSGGLNAAAARAVAAAAGSWAVVHADLPLITSDDVAAVLARVGDRPVLAPSKDGGTSMIAGSGPAFPFHYGPGSFFRHLAALRGGATVVIRPGLSIDVDRPEDLAAINSLRERR